MQRVVLGRAGRVVDERLEVAERAEGLDGVGAHDGVLEAEAHVVQPVVGARHVRAAIALRLRVGEDGRRVHEEAAAHEAGDEVEPRHELRDDRGVVRVDGMVEGEEDHVRELVDDLHPGVAADDVPARRDEAVVAHARVQHKAQLRRACVLNDPARAGDEGHAAAAAPW